ncbi:MAG: hypothetical protein ACRCZP_06175 [Phycicoccus sp.]
MTPSAVHTVIQFVAAVALTAGVFLLFGVPWALVVGGFGVLAASVTAEATRPRPAGRRHAGGGE